MDFILSEETLREAQGTWQRELQAVSETVYQRCTPYLQRGNLATWGWAGLKVIVCLVN